MSRIHSTFDLDPHPFSNPAFTEGLEAAGYLQRLDTSEKRITARYQHALTKMNFARHSEEFLTQAGVRRVHCSTVQFFNEDPVSDPFVHVQVGSLPPNDQLVVLPPGLEVESGWTPIGSKDEADGTIHFTVSHDGYWPITVVFDMNPSRLAREDDYARADSGYEDNAYSRRSRRGSMTGRRSLYDDDASSSDSGLDDNYGASSSRRSIGGGSRRSQRITALESESDEGYLSAARSTRSSRSYGAGRSAGRRASRMEDYSGDDGAGAGYMSAASARSAARSASRASMRSASRSRSARY